MHNAQDMTRDGFRMAMRRLAGTVAILSVAEGGRRYGMTMTAVMSLSMDPPSIALGVNRSASIAEPLRRADGFCVNLLRADQLDFCADFSALPTEQRFSIGAWGADDEGVPFLIGAQANIFCTHGPAILFGTHDLVVGVVRRVEHAPDIAPLVHLDGRYTVAA